MTETRRAWRVVDPTPGATPESNSLTRGGDCWPTWHEGDPGENYSYEQVREYAEEYYPGWRLEERVRTVSDWRPVD